MGETGQKQADGAMYIVQLSSGWTLSNGQCCVQLSKCAKLLFEYFTPMLKTRQSEIE